jgi:hypothetical protein
MCVAKTMSPDCPHPWSPPRHANLATPSAAGPGGARGWEGALPVLYATFSALIGTQSVLFSKTLAVLLRATFSGDNQVCLGVCGVCLSVYVCVARLGGMGLLLERSTGGKERRILHQACIALQGIGVGGGLWRFSEKRAFGKDCCSTARRVAKGQWQRPERRGSSLQGAPPG